MADAGVVGAPHVAGPHDSDQCEDDSDTHDCDDDDAATIVDLDAQDMAEHESQLQADLTALDAHLAGALAKPAASPAVDAGGSPACGATPDHVAWYDDTSGLVVVLVTSEHSHDHAPLTRLTVIDQPSIVDRPVILSPVQLRFTMVLYQRVQIHRGQSGLYDTGAIARLQRPASTTQDANTSPRGGKVIWLARVKLASIGYTKLTRQPGLQYEMLSGTNANAYLAKPHSDALVWHCVLYWRCFRRVVV